VRAREKRQLAALARRGRPLGRTVSGVVPGRCRNALTSLGDHGDRRLRQVEGDEQGPTRARGPRFVFPADFLILPSVAAKVIE
jgi:hypothetical protein